MEYNDFIDRARHAGKEPDADIVARHAVTQNSTNAAPLSWAAAAAVALMLIPASSLLGKAEASEPLSAQVARQTVVGNKHETQPRIVTAWNNSQKYKQYIESYETRNIL